MRNIALKLMYNGTKLNVLHYQTRDYLVLGYYAVLVAAVIALR